MDQVSQLNTLTQFINTMYPIEVGKKTEEQRIHSGTELLITLKVNASKLYQISHPTERDLNSYCHLSDNNPLETHEEDRIEDFESLVLPGQQIKWVGKTLDPESKYTIDIESIVYAYYKENTLDEYKKENFFNAIAICSSDGKTVRTKIKENYERGIFVSIYNINFTIREEGKNPKFYSIDPRLKIDQQ